MCSNHLWPLLWQHALSRWYWHNIILLHTKSSGVTGVPRKCLHTDVNIWTRQNERQRHSVVLTWRYGLTWTFCMDEDVFFFAWKEAYFASADDNGCWRWIEVMWQSWQCMEFVCDNVTILEAWNVASSRLMEFVVVKCWLVVQQRCKRVILAPLHYYGVDTKQRLFLCSRCAKLMMETISTSTISSYHKTAEKVRIFTVF